MFPLILITSAAVILLGTLFFWVQRYKRCPSDKVLVVYGKTKGGRSSNCVHGGAAFVWPVIQFIEFDFNPSGQIVVDRIFIFDHHLEEGKRLKKELQNGLGFMIESIASVEIGTEG